MWYPARMHVPALLGYALAFLLGAGTTAAAASGTAEPPCDHFPVAKQAKCLTIWKQLNDQAVNEVAQFGLAQQKRRDAGQLTPEQHLAENMAFIKRSTARRLKLLEERMAKE